MRARILRWTRSTPTQLIDLELTESVDFAAGQYLTISHPSGEAIPFSIASPPEWLPRLQLHYKPTPGHRHTDLMGELDDRSELELELPFGDVCVDADSAEPLLLLSEETGIAQAASGIRHIVARRSARPVRIGWSAVSGDFYIADELTRYAPEAFVMTRSADLIGRLSALLVGGEEVILCGSPQWVYRHFDALGARGVPPAAVRSDVFGYAPRTG